MTSKISEAQARALRDVRDTGNFGRGVRYATKGSVRSRGLVVVGWNLKNPLVLSKLGRAALEAVK